MTDLPWRKSTRCGTSSCAEVAHTDTAVHMRDSKDPNSPVLTFDPAAWDDFLTGAKRGEFDT